MKESRNMKPMNASLIIMEGGQNQKTWLKDWKIFKAVEGEKSH